MSTEPLLLGIDVGATSIKVGAFTIDGALRALATRPNGPVPDGRGGVTWDLDRIWRHVETALQAVAAQVPRASPQALGVTTFGVDGAPFDAAGRQLDNLSCWHDARSAPHAERIRRELGERRIYDITGYHLAPMATVNHWARLQEEQPGLLDGASWLGLPDIVCLRLTGVRRTDVANASCTAAQDMRTREWAQELLAASGVARELFPDWIRPGEVAGGLTEQAAHACGLPAGLPVVMAGHDAEVAAFAGLGGTPDRFIDIAGTWEILGTLAPEFRPRDEPFERNVDWSPYVDGTGYFAYSNMPGGSVLNWVRATIYDDAGWTELIEEARAAGATAGGVLLLPAFVAEMGPYGRLRLDGTFSGLRTTTARGQLARAALESICYQLAEQLEVLERVAGARCGALRLVGGGGRNRPWLQIRADVLGRPVEAVAQEEVTLLGAAMLAGVGAGVTPSLEEAQAAIRYGVEVFDPDPTAAERYAEQRARFSELVARLGGPVHSRAGHRAQIGRDRSD